jgi:hypothetical protein
MDMRFVVDRYVELSQIGQRLNPKRIIDASASHSHLQAIGHFEVPKRRDDRSVLSDIVQQ